MESTARQSKDWVAIAVGAIAILIVIFMARPVQAADGAAIYKAKCASCHGADGKGETAIGKKMGLRDLGSAEVQKSTDQELFDVTANGKGKMPAYKGKVSDEDIDALVAFMRTFKK